MKDAIELFELFNAIELIGHFLRVGDQKKSDLFFAAYIANQVDDLLLIGRINIGSGFVGNRSCGRLPRRVLRLRVVVDLPKAPPVCSACDPRDLLSEGVR